LYGLGVSLLSLGILFPWDSAWCFVFQKAVEGV